MKFPFKICEVNKQLLINWNHRFSVSREGYDRSIREVVWRRHQSPENKELSLWGIDGTARRRLLWFRDQYSCDKSFNIKSSFIYVNYKAPKAEIIDYVDFLMNCSEKWAKDKVLQFHKILKKDDITCQMKVYQGKHPFELNCSDDYWNLDVTINANSDMQDLFKPFKIFYIAGIRKKIPAGKPTIISDFKRFLPAQVTMGCGPSIEANIPPLNYMHKVYSLFTPEGKFVLKPKDDNFVSSLLLSPEAKYEEMSYIHKANLLAEPTEFYFNLKKCYDKGYFVGPVLTNNFDGLCLSVGVEEFSMRQFDSRGIYPPVSFHPEAKSLFVIGSHADRREVELSARKAKLPIVYIDPCGYYKDGNFTPYPIESPQDEDFLFQSEANNALNSLCNA